MISDIGSTDDTALICNTNRIANIDVGQQLHSREDWFAPDGTTVGDQGSDDVPGFERNRRPMMVQLVRNTTTGTPSEGIYYCAVEDDIFTDETVYVGLYNSGGGGMCKVVEINLPHFMCTQFFRRHHNVWWYDICCGL